jgi:hypothetical protein
MNIVDPQKMISYSLVVRFLFLWFFLGCFAAFAEPYARVCVTTGEAGSEESVLVDNSAPAAGEKLLVHLDASVACTAVILTLANDSSRLANGWRPQIVALPAWTEKVLPQPPVSWEWPKADGPFELWILFFKGDASELEKIKKLLTAMQKSNLTDQVLGQQTRKLCDMLSSRMSGNAQIVHGPKANAPLVGGTTRRADFPWRDYAQKIPLNDALEGELVLRHGR